jgi:hypothetical protein
MYISRHTELDAWSDDGAGALMSISEFGPEGGGAFGYWLWIPSREVDHYFRLSSDFSPGDGSRPQMVSSGERDGVLAGLGATLKREGFSGAIVGSPGEIEALYRDERLRRDGRPTLQLREERDQQSPQEPKILPRAPRPGHEEAEDRLIVLPAAQEVVEASQFVRQGQDLVRGPLSITARDHQLVVLQNGEAVFSQAWQVKPDMTLLRAAVSPSGRLLLIFKEDERGGSSLILGLYSPTGDPRQFKPVASRRLWR